MVEYEKTPEEVVLTRLLRLNATVYGIITGIILGLALFIATNWLVLKGEDIGPHLSLLNQFFIGYRVTFMGSLIGFGYAFMCGAVGGYLVATLYNWIVSLRENKRQSLA